MRSFDCELIENEDDRINRVIYRNIFEVIIKKIPTFCRRIAFGGGNDNFVIVIFWSVVNFDNFINP